MLKLAERKDSVMKVAYVRVSTAEQNEQRQIEAIESKAKIDKWFIDKLSGKNIERENFKQMMNYLREGDEVYVQDWSRLSRSTKDMLATIEKLNEKGVKLISLKENFDTSTPTGKLMLGLISSINQYEREILIERQNEGIEIAKRNNVYKGRTRKRYDEDLYNDVIEKLNNCTITVSEASRRLKVSRQTIYNILKREEGQEKQIANS